MPLLRPKSGKGERSTNTPTLTSPFLTPSTSLLPMSRECVRSSSEIFELVSSLTCVGCFGLEGLAACRPCQAFLLYTASRRASLRRVAVCCVLVGRRLLPWGRRLARRVVVLSGVTARMGQCSLAIFGSSCIGFFKDRRK